ncbi:sensor histidine kinase [Microbispora sp. CA-135349]|uniref:sensor histidine kinase n=1 Tax=Microbispora sp. CA-135349 TaxID=3239953 RepID=UPI003D8F6835
MRGTMRPLADGGAAAGVVLVFWAGPTAGAGSWPSAVTGAVLAAVTAGAMVLRRRAPLEATVAAGVATVAAAVLGVCQDPMLAAAWCLYPLAIERARRTRVVVAVLAGVFAGLALVTAVPEQDALGLGRQVTLAVAALSVAWVLGTTTGKQIATAREAERMRVQLEVARDVHDVVGHALGVILAQSGVILSLPDTREEELRDTLSEVETHARTALEDVQGLVRQLRRPDGGPDGGPGRGPAGLDGLAEIVRAARAAGIDVETRIDEGPSLDEGTSVVVFRVVQEALSNMVRHAPGALHRAGPSGGRRAGGAGPGRRCPDSGRRAGVPGRPARDVPARGSAAGASGRREDARRGRLPAVRRRRHRRDQRGVHVRHRQGLGPGSGGERGRVDRPGEVPRLQPAGRAMTAVEPGRVAGGIGVPDLVRAELTKICTLPATWIALALALSAGTLLGLLAATDAVRVAGQDGQVAIARLGTVLSAPVYAFVAVPVFAAGGEYRTGQVRVSLLAVPDRNRFFLSKLLAILAVMAATALPVVLPGHLARHALGDAGETAGGLFAKAAAYLLLGSVAYGFAVPARTGRHAVGRAGRPADPRVPASGGPRPRDGAVAAARGDAELPRRARGAGARAGPAGGAVGGCGVDRDGRRRRLGGHRPARRLGSVLPSGAEHGAAVDSRLPGVARRAEAARAVAWLSGAGMRDTAGAGRTARETQVQVVCGLRRGG